MRMMKIKREREREREREGKKKIIRSKWPLCRLQFAVDAHKLHVLMA